MRELKGNVRLKNGLANLVFGRLLIIRLSLFPLALSLPVSPASAEPIPLHIKQIKSRHLNFETTIQYITRTIERINRKTGAELFLKSYEVIEDNLLSDVQRQDGKAIWKRIRELHNPGSGITLFVLPHFRYKNKRFLNGLAYLKGNLSYVRVNFRAKRKSICVMIHELLHNLGADHREEVRSVMYRYVNKYTRILQQTVKEVKGYLNL